MRNNTNSFEMKYKMKQRISYNHNRYTYLKSSVCIDATLQTLNFHVRIIFISSGLIIMIHVAVY